MQLDYPSIKTLEDYTSRNTASFYRMGLQSYLAVNVHYFSRKWMTDLEPTQIIRAAPPTTTVSKSGATTTMVLEGQAGMPRAFCVGPDSKRCQKRFFGSQTTYFAVLWPGTFLGPFCLCCCFGVGGSAVPYQDVWEAIRKPGDSMP